MSETEPQDPWVWQGFYGPLDAATAAYNQVTIGEVVGVLIPQEGGPASVDEDDTDWMFAVQTRPDNPMPTPPGMKSARRERVGRLVGA